MPDTDLTPAQNKAARTKGGNESSQISLATEEEKALEGLAGISEIPLVGCRPENDVPKKYSPF